MPKVSVIMPAYKTEEYIKESIQSVQNQTLQDWELLVINDGSPDQLENIVAELATHDPRIRLISQVNQGVAVARNTGIAEAQGEFISFLDSDDLWEPTFLEQMTKKALTQKVDFVYCGFYKYRKNGRPKPVGPPYIEESLLRARIFEIQPIWIGAILIKKNFLDHSSVLFTQGCKFAEDVEFITKLLCLANTGAVKEVLSHYIFRKGSAQRSTWNPNRQDILFALTRLYEFIDKNYVKSDKAIILNRLQATMTSQMYQILRGAIQNNNFSAATILLDTYPHLTKSKSKKWAHDLKFRLIKTRNPLIWNLISKLHFL